MKKEIICGFSSTDGRTDRCDRPFRAEIIEAGNGPEIAAASITAAKGASKIGALEN